MGVDSRIFKLSNRMSGMRGPHGQGTNEEAVEGAKEGERHHHIQYMGMASRNFNDSKCIAGMRLAHTCFTTVSSIIAILGCLRLFSVC